MRSFINNAFTLVSIGNLILFILVFVSWLFDYEPKNLWTVFTCSCNITIVTFLFYLLFGGKTN